MKTKKAKALEYVYGLYDNKGELFALWPDKQDAKDDAVGPRFRPTFTVRTYKLVPRQVSVGKGG